MRYIKQLLIFVFILFILSSCGKKSYVVFDYNCNGREYHKCELKNSKLNCYVETPTCGEYKFKGWYKANEYENQVDLTSNFSKNEIIYARWEKGKEEPSSNEEPVSTITPPGQIEEPSSQVIEEPSSQQPVPEVTYTLSFNANGGSGGQSQSISGIKYGADLPSINQAKPTRSGYTFTGWYDSQTGGTQYYNSSNSPVRKYDKKSNITLYAQWNVETYTISFNANGGSGGQSQSISGIKYGDNMPTISSTKPTKSGYTFLGWYDSQTGGTQYYNSSNVSVRKYDKRSNTTLYAQWGVQTYKVTFNINGGKGTTPNAVDAKYGSAMPTITSTVPTRKYYTFMGWYDNADYTKGTQYYTDKNKSAKNFDKKTNITLYAGWYIDDATPGEFVPDAGSTPKCNKNGKYTLCSPSRGVFGSFPYYDSNPSSTEDRWTMEMDPAWERANFVSIKKTCSNGWKLDFKVHRLAKTAWETALEGLCKITTTGIDGYKYETSDFSFSGTHPVVRFVGGTKVPSDHSYGTAVDINSNAKYTVNGRKYTPYQRELSSYEAFVAALGREDDPRNVNYIIWKKIFQPLGFKWGGNWGRYGNKSTFDGMHFEVDWKQTTAQ